ncbi:GNAT family N-acetyltransferase [Leptothrix sp. BB-4]
MKSVGHGSGEPPGDSAEGHPDHGGADWRWTAHAGLDEVDAAEWDALLTQCDQPTPFMGHAFLAALVDSTSACAETGWQPLVLVARDTGGTLQAAAMLWLKSHSYGEYVFDWAWADAWERAGGRYYPKLLGAVPFTPVPGTRLLARDDAGRARLLQVIGQQVQAMGLSSAHLLFMDEADRRCAEAAGWLLRRTVQFHWENRQPQPYADMADFLASLQRDKRKKIQQERRYVREAGVTVETRVGREITAADWDHFHHCYTLTYRAHHSTPYLSRDFFARMARDLPEHWLMVTGLRDGVPIARSLIALDPLRRVAWGRYWGATEPVRCLHFEACYHAPIEWCIAHGWQRFEGGAQGEHKMARGLLPVSTWSAHQLADRRFHDAVARHLEREGAGMAAYVDELAERNPFKEGAPPAGD